MAWATDRDGVRRFSHVEIEICSHCDCACWGCDRLVDVCPTTPMTVEQVRRFVAESLEMDWGWERIHVLGGEPTLHREFREVIESLLVYKKQYPDVLLRVISNGHGKLSTHRDWLAGVGVQVSVETKKQGYTPDWFANTRLAPVDEDSSYNPVPPCAIFGVKGCGLGLTKHGFFLCGAGASIARVIGADIGVMQLKDVTYAAMLKQAEGLCHLCGHWTGPKRPFRKTNDTGQVNSPYWGKVLTNWCPPAMSLYGKETADEPATS